MQKSLQVNFPTANFEVEIVLPNPFRRGCEASFRWVGILLRDSLNGMNDNRQATHHEIREILCFSSLSPFIRLPLPAGELIDVLLRFQLSYQPIQITLLTVRPGCQRHLHFLDRVIKFALRQYIRASPVCTNHWSGCFFAFSR